VTAPDPLTVIARTLADCPHAHPATQAAAVLDALQGLYVPPPPGSDRDALPEHLRALIAPHMRPYVSTACETALACRLAAEVHPEHAGELREWAQREDAACRQTRKQDMAACTGAGHTTPKESP
jgi:hypothetical protein